MMPDGQRADRATVIAETLAHRLRCFAAFRGLAQTWTGGIVPISTAARMLGVSPQRLHVLIEQARIPVAEIPTGSRHDRMVPVDALMGLGSPLDTGRGRDHHLTHTADRINGKPRNAFLEAIASPAAKKNSKNIAT